MFHGSGSLQHPYYWANGPRRKNATRVYAAAQELASTYYSFQRLLISLFERSVSEAGGTPFLLSLVSQVPLEPLSRLNPWVWENSQSLSCLAAASHGGKLTYSKHAYDIRNISIILLGLMFDFIM